METRESNYQGVFDQRTGFGAHPAVIVIDFIRAYTTPGVAFHAAGVVSAVAATAPLCWPRHAPQACRSSTPRCCITHPAWTADCP